MNSQLFFLPGNEIFAKKLLSHPHFEAGEVVFRRFPDQESYVRLLSDVRGQRVVLLCTLHQPDEKLMMLYVFSKLAKQMGAEICHFSSALPRLHAPGQSLSCWRSGHG
jgi:ribose-phosphate pyrophosphokinase